MRPFRPKLPAGTRALTVGPIALGLLAVSSAPAGAQTPVDPDAYAVFELVQQKFWDRLDGVENYTLYEEQNGLVTTLYYEREMMDGVPVYVLVPPHEWEPELQQAPAATRAPPAPPGAPDLPEGMPGGLPDLPGGLPDLPGGLPNLADAKQALGQKAFKALADRIGSGDDEDPSLGIDPRMMVQLGERARLSGTGPCYEQEDLEALRDPETGRTPENPQCQLLEITDFSGLEFEGQPESVSFTSFKIRLDTKELVARSTTVRGYMEMEGSPVEVVIKASYADYRQVDQMYEPFRRVLRMSGMAEVAAEMMDEKDLKEMEKSLEQLDQMEEQLAQLPEAQRKAIERQMGQKSEQLEKMRDGGGLAAFGDYELKTIVSELLVNAGPPDVTGEWTATVAGLGLALEIKGEVAGVGSTRVGGTDEVWQVTMAVPVSGGLGPSSVIQLTWKRIGRADLAVGETQGFGGVSLVLEDGREGTFQTDEEGAEIRIDLVSRSRITGRFSFVGRGRISDGRTEKEASLTVEGTFEAPAPPPLPAGVIS